MKEIKEKKNEESFWTDFAIYGVITIAVIGFIGYVYGSIAMFSALVFPALLMKGAGKPKTGSLFGNSPTGSLKEKWQNADKKKKAGITIGIIALLPFFILGILWLAMIGAMFIVDVLFILPVILIILWAWFRVPSHQTFAGATALGHPAVLAVGVIMLLLIGVVAGVNYMNIHRYDGYNASDILKPMPNGDAKTLLNKDTNGNGIPDWNDTDIDGDGIPNQWDIDANGNGIIDNIKLYQEYLAGETNATLTASIQQQLSSISKNSDGSYATVDPEPIVTPDDFKDKNCTEPKTYDVVFHVSDPVKDAYFNSRSGAMFGSFFSFFKFNPFQPNLFANLTINRTAPVYNASEAANLTKAGKPFSEVYYSQLPISSSYRQAPVPNAIVTLSGGANKSWALNPKTGLAYKEHWTDAAGNCVFHHVTAGEYTLTVESAGYFGFSTSVVIVNETKHINVALTPTYLKLHIQVHAKGNAVAFTGRILGWITTGGGHSFGVSAQFLPYSKEQYAALAQQNNMFGWSGVPQGVINPSFGTQMMFQSMFNSMGQGLNDMSSGWHSQNSLINEGATKEVFDYADITTYTTFQGNKPMFALQNIISGSPHITKDGGSVTYVVWPKGMVDAQNGMMVHATINVTAHFTSYGNSIGIQWPPYQQGSKERVGTATFGADYLLQPQDYQVFNQAGTGGGT